MDICLMCSDTVEDNRLICERCEKESESEYKAAYDLMVLSEVVLMEANEILREENK